MKRETERSLHEHFKDYRENLKFQYMLRLVKETSSRLYEGLTEHFQLYVSDLETVISSMGSERSDQKALEETLKQIEAEIQPMNKRMETLRESIRQMRGLDMDGDVFSHAASAKK